MNSELSRSEVFKKYNLGLNFNYETWLDKLGIVPLGIFVLYGISGLLLFLFRSFWLADFDSSAFVIIIYLTPAFAIGILIYLEEKVTLVRVFLSQYRSVALTAVERVIVLFALFCCIFSLFFLYISPTLKMHHNISSLQFGILVALFFESVDEKGQLNFFPFVFATSSVLATIIVLHTNLFSLNGFEVVLPLTLAAFGLIISNLYGSNSLEGESERFSIRSLFSGYKTPNQSPLHQISSKRNISATKFVYKFDSRPGRLYIEKLQAKLRLLGFESIDQYKYERGTSHGSQSSSDPSDWKTVFTLRKRKNQWLAEWRSDTLWQIVIKPERMQLAHQFSFLIDENFSAANYSEYKFEYDESNTTRFLTILSLITFISVLALLTFIKMDYFGIDFNEFYIWILGTLQDCWAVAQESGQYLIRKVFK